MSVISDRSRRGASFKANAKCYSIADHDKGNARDEKNQCGHWMTDTDADCAYTPTTTKLSGCCYANPGAA